MRSLKPDIRALEPDARGLSSPTQTARNIDIKMEEDFSKRVARLIRDAGGQSALARKTGMSPGAIQRYLRGGDPTRAVLIRMAQTCGVSLDWLVYGREDAAPAPPEVPAALSLYGFSDSGQQGWYTEVPYRIGARFDWPDPDLFAIVAPDSGMACEGIRSGFVCFVSPNTRPNRSDVVFFRKNNNTSALRRYLGVENGWIQVEGFADPADGGPPVPLRESLRPDTLALTATVVAVRRRA